MRPRRCYVLQRFTERDTPLATRFPSRRTPCRPGISQLSNKFFCGIWVTPGTLLVEERYSLDSLLDGYDHPRWKTNWRRDPRPHQTPMMSSLAYWRRDPESAWKWRILAWVGQQQSRK
ncbi:hypothetical protein BJX66DRAFT_320945, partial [Aspergillus keveii]